jgi:hypothetical protein
VIFCNYINIKWALYAQKGKRGANVKARYKILNDSMICGLNAKQE